MRLSMKQIFTALALWLAWAASASAQSVWLSPAISSAAEGDTITIDIEMDATGAPGDTPGSVRADILLTWDSAQLNYESFAYVDANDSLPLADSDGRLEVSFNLAPLVSRLGTVTFRVVGLDGETPEIALQHLFGFSTFANMMPTVTSFDPSLAGATLSISGAGTVAGPPAGSDVTYFYPDALGSPVGAADASGQLLWTSDFAPFGYRADTPANAMGAAALSENRRAYTDHQEDMSSGLVYMGARYYDPVIGRFYSADSAGFDAADPVSVNRYAYAYNSPYKYTDPDGNIPLDTIWDIGNVAYDLGKIAYGVATDDDDLVKEGAADLVMDAAAVVVPYYPAGANRVVRAVGSGISDAPKALGKVKDVEIPPGYGVVYKVPGGKGKTDSDLPYIGTADDFAKRAKTAKDGRLRDDDTEIIGIYKIDKTDKTQRRRMEQEAINREGGIDFLDNKRNEIAEKKWGDFGVSSDPYILN